MILTLFCSCSSTEPETQHDLSTLHLNFIYEPFSLDPRHKTDPITLNLAAMLYEGLTHIETDGSLSLALADKVEVLANNTVYLFTLKKSFYSDGRPLTAEDFVRSWRELLAPHFPATGAQLLFPILNARAVKAGSAPPQALGVQALTPSHLKITLETPHTSFLRLLAHPVFSPVYPSHLSHAHTLPITNGPFTICSMQRGHSMLLTHNPHFHLQEAIPFKQIEILLVKNATTALELFQKGQLDWIGGMLSPIPLAALEYYQEKGRLHTHPIGGTTFCVYNQTHPLLQNRKIRAALSDAIDRPQIVNSLLGGFDEPASSLVPPILTTTTTTNPPAIDCCPERAVRLFAQGLKELGLADQPRPIIDLSYYCAEVPTLMAQAIQSQWQAELGLTVKLHPSDLATHLTHLKKGAFEVALASWIASYADPLSFLERLESPESPCNYSGWDSPPFRAVVEQIRQADTHDQREALIGQAETILRHEIPLTPINHYHLTYLSHRPEQVGLSPLGLLDLRQNPLPMNQSD